MTSPEISVVVLAYREGSAIELFVKKLQDTLGGAHLNYEIILVSNYKPHIEDETPGLARKLAERDPRILAITNVKKKGEGMGWDARRGMDMARGETIAFIDGDGQMPAEDVVAVYHKLKEEGLDLCKTVRIERQDGWKRKITSIMYNTFVHMLFPGIQAHDINGKPKIFTREAYRKLNLESNGWFLDGEIMIKAGELGLKHGAIPTVFKANEHRESMVKPGMILAFIGNIIIYRFKSFF